MVRFPQLWHGDGEFWKRVSTFLEMDYWTRLWIIQEMIFASKLAIICGPVTLTWASLLNTYEFLMSILVIHPPSFFSSNLWLSLASFRRFL